MTEFSLQAVMCIFFNLRNVSNRHRMRVVPCVEFENPRRGNPGWNTVSALLVYSLEVTHLLFLQSRLTDNAGLVLLSCFSSVVFNSL